MSKAILKTFENKELGRLRLIYQHGFIWFDASDICKALDIPSFVDALSNAEKKENRVLMAPLVKLKAAGQAPLRLRLISQADVHAFVVQSQSRKAYAFRHWVTSLILPSLKAKTSHDNNDQ